MSAVTRGATGRQSRRPERAVRWLPLLGSVHLVRDPIGFLTSLTEVGPLVRLRLGLREVGTLEPKPGLPPSTGHLNELLEQLKRTPAKAVVRAAYNEPRAAEWLAERTKMLAITVPYTVGGTDAADVENYHSSGRSSQRDEALVSFFLLGDESKKIIPELVHSFLNASVDFCNLIGGLFLTFVVLHEQP